MHESVEWYEILFRLALAILAGAVLGYDRSERGRPAGLRTTMLVALAAAVAMIQANLLLSLSGKTPESFGSMDYMRLPLGILTGMGFIGAGSVLRRGNRIEGVTTAASLWTTTVIGLCFGGGQLALGSISLVIALVILKGLSRLDQWLKPGSPASLLVTLNAEGPSESSLQKAFTEAGYSILSQHVKIQKLNSPHQKTTFRWHLRSSEANRILETPAFVEAIANKPGVLLVRWQK
jgi:putative Mg2+ transporter-C (MgtC) family protein